MTHKILREPEVKGRTGLSRPQRFRMAKKGTFPAPIYITERAKGWLESEIDAWIEERVEKSREASHDR
jgi:prophage regulatory protein